MSVETLIPGPFAPEQLRIEWLADVAPLSSCAHGRIEHQWSLHLAAAREKGVSLFNGPIVTLSAARVERHGILHLTLAPTDYKTFLVTCIGDHAWFAAHAPEAIAPALGNSALLTCGDSAYLGVRSPRVATYAGRAHVLGGVPEPADRPLIPADLLAHLHAELAEEAALTPADVARPPTLMGLFRDPALRQPELVWHIELRAPLYKVDRAKHDAVFMLYKGDRVDSALLTPLAAAAVALWQRE